MRSRGPGRARGGVVLHLLLGIVTVLAQILVVPGLMLGSLQTRASALPHLPADPDAPANLLVAAVRIQTVSYEDSVKADRAAFVVPSLATLAPDARPYGNQGNNVYRLLPIAITAEDLVRFYGIDGRIAVKRYADAIAFCTGVLRRAGSKQTGVGQ